MKIYNVAYFPITINDMLKSVQGIVSNPKNELTGEEYIVDAWFTDQDSADCPAHTVCFLVTKIDEETGEDVSGTIYVAPKKSKYLM